MTLLSDLKLRIIYSKLCVFSTLRSLNMFFEFNWDHYQVTLFPTKQLSSKSVGKSRNNRVTYTENLCVQNC